MSYFRNLAFCCAILGTVVAVNVWAAPTDAAKHNAGYSILASENNAAKVNINTADLSTLHTVKGIGPKKGQAIIDYRTQNGPYKSVDDLLKVKCRGINKKWLDKIRDRIVI